MSTPKTRRERPFPVPPQTVVNIGQCACCKGRVQVRINVAGKAYYNCGNFDESGNSCGFQVRWGAVKSQGIRAAYHKREGLDPKPLAAANVNGPPSNVSPVSEPEAANDNAAPVTKRTGSGGALEQFGY